MIKELTPEEVEYIIEYTGMDMVMEHSLQKTPVVYFSRNGNILEFVTMFSKELNTV